MHELLPAHDDLTAEEELGEAPCPRGAGLIAVGGPSDAVQIAAEVGNIPAAQQVTLDTEARDRLWSPAASRATGPG